MHMCGIRLEPFVKAAMNSFAQCERLLTLLVLLVFVVAFLPPSPAAVQDRSAEVNTPRGDRAEIAVTVRDTQGRIILSPATVKVYHSGVLTAQEATSEGRAFFILHGLGDYVVNVEATGYKTAQKDISVRIAVRDEEDIYLRSSSATEADSNVPGKPLLAPKAKEALEKGLEALKDNKLDEAQKHLEEAMKLAPSHPDVLYGRALVYLKRSDWANAQTLLEKATQVDPKHALAWSALGMAFVNAGKFDRAIPPLQESLALEPAKWETHWALAKAYYNQQQYEQAVKESQEGWTESHGASPEIELLLAQSLTAVGRYQDAVLALRDFLKNHPDGPRADTARRWLEQLTAELKSHPE